MFKNQQMHFSFIMEIFYIMTTYMFRLLMWPYSERYARIQIYLYLYCVRITPHLKSHGFGSNYG